MADYTKNLMVKIHDVLAAESTVTDLLAGQSADSINYWVHSDIHEMAGRTTPFINIVPSDSTRDLEMGHRRNLSVTVDVEYYFPDRIDEDQLDIFDDIAIIEGFLLGSDLESPSFDGEKTFLKDDGFTRDFDIVSGRKIVRWTMIYRYDQNKA
jgi:hypothetical protein